MRKIYLLMILMVLSCGGDKDEYVLPPKEAVVSPYPSVLTFPQNNTKCLEGEIISDSRMSIEFQWNTGANTTSFELLITNLNTGQSQTYSTKETSYIVELDRATPYSWKITSLSDQTTDTATSATYKFYTMGLEQHSYAPFPAELLAPEAKVSFDLSQSQNATLSWIASDVDSDELTYTVLADTVSPPTKVIAENLTASPLEFRADHPGTYYWKVLTHDPEKNTSASSVSQFTFELNPEKSAEKDILAFVIEQQGVPYEGVIDEETSTITLTLGNFDYKRLAPQITISPNATVSPAEQVPMNFLDDLFYTVTAEDGSQKVYDIIVNSGQHEIRSFEIHKNGEDFIGNIDHEQSLITIDLGQFDYSQLAPEVRVSNKANLSPASGTLQNFNGELTYTVTSENGTQKSYSVVSPIRLSYARQFFSYKSDNNIDFKSADTQKDVRMYAGGDLSFTAYNVQSPEDLTIALENETGSFPLKLKNVHYSTYSKGSSIKTDIPYSIPAGTYSFRIYDQHKQAVYDHKLQVINNDSIIRITGINKSQDVKYSDTLVITGVNLRKDFVIKNGSEQHLFKESYADPDIILNEDRTELKIIVSGIYSRIRWGGPDTKPMAMQGTIDGYASPLNSNTISFSF